jgi:hypothetical protein
MPWILLRMIEYLLKCYRSGGSLMNMRVLVVWLLRIVLPIPIALFIYRVDALGGGNLIDRGSNNVGWLTIWALMIVFRTGVGIFLLRLFQGVPLGEPIDRRSVLLSGLIIGLPLYYTWIIMSIVLAPYAPSHAGTLTWLSPGPLLDYIRELLRTRYFEGYTHIEFIMIYFTWIEPLLVELPRILLLILLGNLMAKRSNNYSSSDIEADFPKTKQDSLKIG